MDSKKNCFRCGRCCKTSTLLADSSWTLKVARFVILLFKGKFKALFASPDCPFLVSDGKISGCLQYENRPQFCRDYFCKNALKVIHSSP